MLSTFRFLQIKTHTFLWLFASLLLWIPTSVGGWLVHFEIISNDLMWAASAFFSIVFALYWSAQE